MSGQSRMRRQWRHPAPLLFQWALSSFPKAAEGQASKLFLQRSQKKQQKHKDGEVLSGCRGSEQQGGGETGLQLRREEEGGGGCQDLIRGVYSRSVAFYLGVTIAGGSLCQLPFNQKPQRKIEQKSD